MSIRRERPVPEQTQDARVRVLIPDGRGETTVVRLALKDSVKDNPEAIDPAKSEPPIEPDATSS